MENLFRDASVQNQNDSFSDNYILGSFNNFSPHSTSTQGTSSTGIPPGIPRFQEDFELKEIICGQFGFEEGFYRSLLGKFYINMYN